MSEKQYDLAIVGGLGHVGFPLGVAFADKGLNVCLYDINAKAAEQVKSGKMPFIEYGAEPIFARVLREGRLHVSLDIESIGKAKHNIITNCTPVDAYNKPEKKTIKKLISKMAFGEGISSE